MGRYAESLGLSRIRFKGKGNRDFRQKGWKLFRVLQPDPIDPDTAGSLCCLVQVSPPHPRGEGVAEDTLMHFYPGDVVAMHGATTCVEEDEECEPVPVPPGMS